MNAPRAYGQQAGQRAGQRASEEPRPSRYDDATVVYAANRKTAHDASGDFSTPFVAAADAARATNAPVAEVPSRLARLDAADLFVGATSIGFGIVVVILAVARWQFFAQTRRARAIASRFGEGAARAVYVALGAILVAIGVWVLVG